MINTILAYVPDINFTEWRTTLMQKAIEPYETALGMIFWVLMFAFIIGYVYMKQQSYVAVAVIILIIVSVFGNYLVGMDSFQIFLIAILSLASTGLVIYFIGKRRNA